MSAVTEPFEAFDIDGDEIVVDEGGTDVFLDADELLFQGTKLNTAPRRYIFVQSWGLKLFEQGDVVELNYPGYSEDAAKVVFACLASKEQLILWKGDDDLLESDFQDWQDEVELLPRTQVEADICNLAAAVLNGWYSAGNVPEDDDPKAGARS